MINDQCDIVECDNVALFEIEENDGEFYFVCANHAKGKNVIRSKPNKSEKKLYKPKKVIKYQKRGKDFDSREVIKNVETGNEYVLVEGIWHTTTKEGEPLGPVKKSIEFEEVN